LSGPEKLPFDSAKNLVLSFGGAIAPPDGKGIELVSLAGLHALIDLVTLEVSTFLKERSGNEQMMIFPLDESLTSMLWNRSLRLFGNDVNLAVWLPFTTTSAARRLLMEIEKAEKSGRMPDLKKFATTCAVELSKNREKYVREECQAFETAISFATLLDFWKERLGASGRCRENANRNEKVPCHGKKNGSDTGCRFRPCFGREVQPGIDTFAG